MDARGSLSRPLWVHHRAGKDYSSKDLHQQRKAANELQSIPRWRAAETQGDYKDISRGLGGGTRALAGASVPRSIKSGGMEDATHVSALPVTGVSSSARKKKWRPHCRHPTCLRPASYAAVSGEDPVYCEKHKEEGMLNVVHPNRGECKQEGCRRVSAYASTAATLAVYCYLHKRDGMVKVRDGIGTRCEDDKCVKQASFALEGERYPRFCKDHKQEDMINIRNNRCVWVGCVRGASFAPLGERRGLYCGEHKSAGMVNTRRRPRCVAPGCTSREPVFVMDGQQVPRYCAEHKTHEMKDVRQAARSSCAVSDSSEPVAHTETAGEPQAVFCDARMDALDSSSAQARSSVGECMAANCSLTPSHGWEAAMVPVLCSSHAQEGMVKVTPRTRPSVPYGMPPTRPASKGPPDVAEGVSASSQASREPGIEHLPMPPARRIGGWRDGARYEESLPRTRGRDMNSKHPNIRRFGSDSRQRSPEETSGTSSSSTSEPYNSGSSSTYAAKMDSALSGAMAHNVWELRDKRARAWPLDASSSQGAAAGADRVTREGYRPSRIACDPAGSEEARLRPSRHAHRSLTSSVGRALLPFRGPDAARNDDGERHPLHGPTVFLPRDRGLGEDDSRLSRSRYRPRHTSTERVRVKTEIGAEDEVLPQSEKRAYRGWQSPAAADASKPAAPAKKNVGLEDCHPPGYARTDFYYSLLSALTGSKRKRTADTSKNTLAPPESPPAAKSVGKSAQLAASS